MSPIRALLLTYLVLLFCFALSLAAPLLEQRGTNGVSQSTFDNLVRYAKYSSAVYQPICPRPVGNTLVKTFDISGTQGFVVRDDSRREIVLAFRGTFEPIDVLTDVQVLLTPLDSPGITDIEGVWVHTGFQKAFNIVVDRVHSIMKGQLDAHPGYTTIITGHSLGGAVASFAALSLNVKYPARPIKLYTYGAPRVGNPAFASLVEDRLGLDNIFRGVHTFDGIPTLIGRWLGYRHFGTEYWQFNEPANPSTVRKCDGGEDPTCSNSIISTGLNPAHAFQFGQLMAVNPLLCI